jgi:protein-disulfide isomerase
MAIGHYFCVAAFLVSSLQAQTPSVLNYQGRLRVDGKPFDGQGYFTFAILDGARKVLWASSMQSGQSTNKLPAEVVAVHVTNGLYSARLGDPALGLRPLDLDLLRRASDPKLLVRFNDGTNGWRQAGDEIPLAPMIGATGDVGGMNALQAAVILRELRELRAMVARQQAPPAALPGARPVEPRVATVSLGNSVALGQSEAPLVLLEFTDYQCPYCRQFQETILPGLITNYVQTGKLRIVSRNLPLTFHPDAEIAALAVLCAGSQGKYWPMREKVFASSASLTLTNLIKASEELKLDVTAFRSCVEKKDFLPQAKQDMEDAGAAGITGTPTFVLGRSAEGKVTGVVIEGAKPYNAFSAEIEKLLASLVVGKRPSQ